MRYCPVDTIRSLHWIGDILHRASERLTNTQILTSANYNVHPLDNLLVSLLMHVLASYLPSQPYADSSKPYGIP